MRKNLIWLLCMLPALFFWAACGDDDDDDQGDIDPQDSQCADDADCESGQRCLIWDSASDDDEEAEEDDDAEDEAPQGVCMDTCETDSDCTLGRVCDHREGVEFGFCNMASDENTDDDQSEDDDQ